MKTLIRVLSLPLRSKQ